MTHGAHVTSDLISIPIVIHAGNPDALRVSPDGIAANGRWLKRSEITDIQHQPEFCLSILPDGFEVELGTATITLSKAYATEKGLI